MNVESPCIGVCQLAENQAVCVGCHRTLSEISAWHRLTDTEKFRVLTSVRERQAVQKVKTAAAQTP
jgi:predicted Fe-S protein YdhL (DUF1289 family)